MDAGGSSPSEEQKNKKQSVEMTEKELEEKRLESVIPTSWNDKWIVTLNITDNVLEDEVVEGDLSDFQTDSPMSEDAASGAGSEAGEDGDSDEEAGDDNVEDKEKKKKKRKEEPSKKN